MGFGVAIEAIFSKRLLWMTSNFLSKHMMKKARTLPKLDLASTRRTIINAWGGSIGNNTNSAFWGRSAEFEVNLKVEFDPLFPSNVIFSLDDEIFWGRSEKDYDAAQFSDSYFNFHRWAEGRGLVACGAVYIVQSKRRS